MKKSILQIITLALTVLNLVLCGVIVFTCVPAINKTSKLVDRICEIVDLDVAGPDAETETIDITKLEEIAVTFNGETTTRLNLKTDVDGKPHVIVAGVTIVVNSAHEDYKTMRPSIDTAMSMINDKIIAVITKYTMNQANNNKDEIRKEILGELQSLFNSTFIYDISFTSFITQ